MAIKTTKITLDYATADERLKAWQCTEWLRNNYGSPGTSNDRLWFTRMRRPSYKRITQSNELFDYDPNPNQIKDHVQELMDLVSKMMDTNKYTLVIYFRKPEHATHFALTML